MMKKNMVAHASASHGEDGEEKKIQKSYFDVLGICCPSEVPLIENILKSMDGVKDVSVIVPTKTVIVLHDSILTSQLQIGIFLKCSFLFLIDPSVTWRARGRHVDGPLPFLFSFLVSLYISLIDARRYISLSFPINYIFIFYFADEICQMMVL